MKIENFMKEEIKQFKSLQDFLGVIPERWKDKDLWVRAYRMLHATDSIFKGGMITADFSDTRAVAFYGTIQYSRSDPPLVQSSKSSEIVQMLATLSTVDAQDGAYILFITPLEGNEPSARRRLDEVVGLFAVINGLSSVYDYLFDNIVNISKNTYTYFSPVVPNPFWFEAPDLSDARINEIIGSYKKIDGQGNILLSLRWFNEGIRKLPFDAFIPLWIALETLVSAKGKYVVHKINEGLAKYYGIPKEETVRKFRIGRLYGLRTRIFHDGEILPLHGDTIDYMAAIYSDLLFGLLDLTPEKRAEGKLRLLARNLNW